ncbi:hypothetical protein I8J29_27405 [Paenibacillus sp. MWE-103]|uniref:HNH endonuclease n=1 Tax=Paenibacillus artemisiicola TaxID=1172618 RepID=A0ABS3WHX5_9BACL|nr:hypothetical protein [Paenibacillus artemisiicola]MBO7747924.1 hypothetical protein [Paenibacillus artemisiicola]
MTTTTAPTPSTVKMLFAVSSNQCSFPTCTNPLVDGKKVTGRICHIKARSEGGPRYDPTQTNDERRGFDNLLLMCPIHHDIIDSDVDSYTVERLQEIKKKHESAATEMREESEDIANQLILNLNVTSRIEIHNEYQNNGQLANIIVNYFVPDNPNKQCRVSSRRILTSIQNITKELQGRSEISPRHVVTALLLLPSSWEQCLKDVSDYLNTEDCATLITFYETVTQFNQFLEVSVDRINQMNPMGMPFGHPAMSKISHAYDSYLHEILDIDLKSLIDRLDILGK